MKQEILLIGMLLIIIGIVFISMFLAGSGKSKVAVVGFLGPIPFGAGNDAGMVKLAMILTGIAIVAFMTVNFLFPRLGRIP